MWTKETHWKHDVLAYHRKYEKERKKILDKKVKKQYTTNIRSEVKALKYKIKKIKKVLTKSKINVIITM